MRLTDRQWATLLRWVDAQPGMTKPEPRLSAKEVKEAFRAYDAALAEIATFRRKSVADNLPPADIDRESTEMKRKASLIVEGLSRPDSGRSSVSDSDREKAKDYGIARAIEDDATLSLRAPVLPVPESLPPLPERLADSCPDNFRTAADRFNSLFR